ncbi:Flp family type IVb pilin [Methylobacterium sp. 77]|uniref:Flp family type IVb pilin n=1 Tax=Methylobacterium sp. 77 TaxID=1101192 RepID=UPI0012DDD01B|nr:Flp family type IVb pilin [Methylobacterium sp. 77]
MTSPARKKWTGVIRQAAGGRFATETGSTRLGRRFARNTDGATAIEYALIAGLVFLAIAGALRLYADRVGTMYQNIGTAVAKNT